MQQTYPFVLPPLPYSYNALEPQIDEETIRVHHDTLFQNYVNKLNAALQPYPQYHHYTLEELIINNDQLPKKIQTTVFNNAGGVFNHTRYFATMTPHHQQPSAYMTMLLRCSFDSINQFKSAMLQAGLSIFGSGWAWLVMDQDKRLRIITTKNQDTPLSQGYLPLLPLDVWEHAYFLQYLAARNDYIEQWFQLINWHEAEKMLTQHHINRDM